MDARQATGGYDLGALMNRYSAVKSRLNHFYEMVLLPSPSALPSRCPHAHDEEPSFIKDYSNGRKTHLMSNLSKIIKSRRELETILRICLFQKLFTLRPRPFSSFVFCN